MPRKTEVISTFYRGVVIATNPDGTVEDKVIAESKFRNTVKRRMRHHPNGEIQERNLVGYYTPWAASPEPEPQDGEQ